jgi:hypothetical protein
MFQNKYKNPLEDYQAEVDADDFADDVKEAAAKGEKKGESIISKNKNYAKAMSMHMKMKRGSNTKIRCFFNIIRRI